MSQQITTAFVKQFTNGITLLQQQMGSNLRNAVSVESNITGDRAFFDQVDATAMAQITTRHGDTTLTDTPHKRRMVTMAPFEVADLVDRPDKIRTLNDPTNSYVRSFAAAAGRTIDDQIIAAFDAAASTGVDGGTSTVFDTDFSIAEGSANLTTAKLITARRLLEAAENPEDSGDNQWYVVCSAAQRKGLLGDTQFENSDYNSIKALVHGEVDTWLGFKFLKSERLTTAASTNITTCFAFRKSSMKLAIGQEPRGFIDVLPGKRHSTQIRYELDVGATRMDEKGVVRIFCDDDL